MDSPQYRRYWALLLILFSSLVPAGCLNMEPQKLNAVAFEVQIRNHQFVEDSVRASIEEVNAREYSVPSVDTPPFVAFRGEVIPQDNKNKTHFTRWALVPYKGAGKYKAVVITKDLYNIQKGDKINYYISLRSKNVKWSEDFIGGSIVLE